MGLATVGFAGLFWELDVGMVDCVVVVLVETLVLG
jgi:hypothetical protein